MVRLRKVYSPAGSPGSSAAQCIFPSRIGHPRGWPVAWSKPRVFAGIFPSGKTPQCFGGPRICASIHGAFEKDRSSSGRSVAFDSSEWGERLTARHVAEFFLRSEVRFERIEGFAQLGRGRSGPGG